MRFSTVYINADGKTRSVSIGAENALKTFKNKQL